MEKYIRESLVFELYNMLKNLSFGSAIYCPILGQVDWYDKFEILVLHSDALEFCREFTYLCVVNPTQ